MESPQKMFTATCGMVLALSLTILILFYFLLLLLYISEKNNVVFTDNMKHIFVDLTSSEFKK